MNRLSGAIVEVEAEAVDGVREPGPQLDLFTSRDEGPDALADVIDGLRAMLGDEQVFCSELVSTHRPEAAWRRVPWGTTLGRRSVPVPTWPTRPTAILKSPEPVLLRAGGECDGRHEGQPGELVWRGEVLRLAGTGGFERLEAEWWTPRPVTRDYLVVDVLDGRRLWLFRQGATYFLHGIFD